MAGMAGAGMKLPEPALVIPDVGACDSKDATEIVMLLYEGQTVQVNEWKKETNLRRLVYRKRDELQEFYLRKLEVSSRKNADGVLLYRGLTTQLTSDRILAKGIKI